MAKRIEIGERVVGQTIPLGKGDKRRVIGTLRQRPGDGYEPYLIHCDGDPDSCLTPVYIIERA